MARLLKNIVQPELKVLLELNESEVRALAAVFGYDVNIFLKVFYEKMGAAYVKPNEEGVRSLHKTIRAELAAPLALVDKARATLRGV